MPQSVTDFEIVRTNQTEPLTIYVNDPRTNELVDVDSSSSFALIDIADDSDKDSGTFTADGSAVITHPSTGVYQYAFDASTYTSEYLLAVRCTLESEVINQNLFVKSVSARRYAYCAQLRLQVDKARKTVSDDIENIDRVGNEPAIRFFFGYDDKHLQFYLERGVQYINAIPPYTAWTVDGFPAQFLTILIDAATIAALESQGIFAIDTDYNYSLGGNSLVIDHFTKLSTMVRQILERFQKTAVALKQRYRSKGLVIFQWMPGGVRAARMLNAMPPGFWSRMLSSVYI